ncbi:hypothetical protein niasHS_004955 [Heterodera schachtii]|uniref:Uncharacterized protein n=1 Tax=Heterodera schachtii TaxID=97005 RepID=A0ABD2K194_HETSC
MSSSFDVFKMTDDDAMKFLVSESHIGTKKMDYQMEHNLSMSSTNIRKTWEKLLFAARAVPSRPLKIPATTTTPSALLMMTNSINNNNSSSSGDTTNNGNRNGGGEEQQQQQHVNE